MTKHLFWFSHLDTGQCSQQFEPGRGHPVLGLPGDQVEKSIVVFDLSHTNLPSVSTSSQPIQAVRVCET